MIELIDMLESHELSLNLTGLALQKMFQNQKSARVSNGKRLEANIR